MSDTRPAYYDHYPCAACGMGSLDCHQTQAWSLRCCSACDGHPERIRRGADAYTDEEWDDMWERVGGRPKDQQ